MQFKLKNRQLIYLIQGIFFLNILFLAGTYVFHYYFYNVQQANWENGSRIKYFWVEFSLATENVLAVWYSSMLLFTVSLVFFVVYLIHKKEHQNGRKRLQIYNWLLISGVFCLLSLDEMASLHERLGNLGVLNPFGDYAPGWVLLLALPIAFVAGFVIWFSLLQIKRAPLAAVFAVAGIIIFASIPVQEYFEMEAWKTEKYAATWKRPVISLLLEEGSELFGTTCMLVSGLLFLCYGSRAGKKTEAEDSAYVRLQLNRRNTLFQFAAGTLFLVLLMFLLVNSNILVLKGDHGKLENWFPAATAFFFSLLCIYLYLHLKKFLISSRTIFLYLGLFSLFISAYYGSNVYIYFKGGNESSLKLILIAVFALTTIGLALKCFAALKDSYVRAAIIFWACLLIPSFGITGMFSAALVFTSFSLLSLSFLNIIISERLTFSTTLIQNKNNVEV